MGKKKRRHPVPIVNHTRYFTRDLEVIVDMIAGLSYTGVVVFKPYTAPKGKKFRHGDDPVLVKFSRVKKEHGKLHVGVVRPVRTGAPFVGIPELEAIACMHTRTAPVCLRRQLLVYIGQRAVNFASDRRAHEYDYDRPDWNPNPPELRFMDTNRSAENIEWQEERVKKMKAMALLSNELQSTRQSVSSNRRQMNDHRKRMVIAQGKAEELLGQKMEMDRDFAMFLAREPLPGKEDG
jgi:hypothetical protein